MTRSGRWRLAAGLACVLAVSGIAASAASERSGPKVTSAVGRGGDLTRPPIPGAGQLSEEQAARLAASVPNDPPAVVPERKRPRMRPPYGTPVEDTVEPTMLPPGSDGAFSTSYMWPVRNGWQVGNHRMFTAVYAGGDGVGRPGNSTGRFVIFRDDYIRVTQKSEVVDVPDVGPVKITKAPLGDGIQGWAQRHGRLRFKSDRGATGVLDLATDKATLDG